MPTENLPTENLPTENLPTENLPTEKERNQELEQKARIALLNHYSSKSSNQVTNVLTSALGFFALITAIEPLKVLFGDGTTPFLNLSCKILCDILIASITFVLILVVVHAILRLIRYGELASLVLWCEMASRERTKESQAANKKAKETIENKVKEKMEMRHYSGNVSLDSVSMYMTRLSLGCADLYDARYLTKSEEPFVYKKITWRYARWRESFILASLSLIVLIPLIVMNGVS